MRTQEKLELKISSTSPAPKSFSSLLRRQISIPPHKTPMSQVPKHPPSSIQYHHLRYRESKQKPNDNMRIFQMDSPQSLSFCNLTISERHEIRKENAFERRPAAPDEEFEFFASFTDLHFEKCFADEIFSHGKLHPFKPPTPKNKRTTTTTTTTTQGQVWNSHKKDFLNAKKGRATTHRSSSEYRKLEKNPRPTRLQTQMPKGVSNGMSSRNGSRPKWYQLMFGSIGMPAEMDMSDIRSRLRRRSPVSVVQAAAGDEEEEGKRMWKLVSAMSCRSVADVGTPLKIPVARVRVG